jgi:N-acetylglucosaminyldiphosphoundecaprenol N-acetyl-beta-D-mannosaminyltransferase
VISYIERANILGVGVSAINRAIALEIIDQWISRREAHYICVTTVHGVVESYADPELRAIHNAAGLVTPDGMPLVWLSRLQGFRHVERVYGPDLMLDVCGHSVANGIRHFLYGGGPGIVERLAKNLTARFPELQIVGTYAPPFRDLTPAEDANVTRLISTAKPDIVWVGIGTPKQERWMAHHAKRIGAPVVIGVGAAFDFHAGVKRQAPRWMMRAGLEWLFRLAHEPRRLARRYLIGNPRFLLLVLFQMLGFGTWHLDGQDPAEISAVETSKNISSKRLPV